MDSSFINKKILEELNIIDEKLVQDFDFNLPNIQKELAVVLLNYNNLIDSYPDFYIDNKIKELGINEEDLIKYISAISLYQTKKDYTYALEIFQNLQQKYPNILNFPYYQGIIYMEFEMFDDAIFCFQSMLDVHPQNYQAMFGIANSLMLSGHYDEAIIHYQNISEIYPDNIEAILFIGVTQNLLGNHLDALNIFDNINKIRPQENISNYKGYTYFLLGKYDNAINHYTKYLESNSEDYRALYMIGKIYNQKNLFNKSQFYLSLALDLSQSNYDFSVIPDILFEIGLSYFGFGEYQTASDYFDWLIGIDGYYISAYIKKSECLFNLGDVSGAKKVLKDAISKVGQNDELLDTLSKMQDA